MLQMQHQNLPAPVDVQRLAQFFNCVGLMGSYTADGKNQNAKNMTIEEKVEHVHEELASILGDSEDKVKNSVYQQDSILSQVSYQNLNQALKKLVDSG